MNRRLIGIISCIVLVTAISVDADAQRSKGKAKAKAQPQQAQSFERQFMTQAAQSGQFEVAANRLALQRAKHPEVRQHSEHMVRDHTAANQRLAALAKRKNFRLPTDMGAKHRAEVDRLRKLNGNAFDRAHASSQLRAHKEAVALFTRAVKNSKDTDVRNFAANTLPKLEEHLHMWERAVQELNDGR